MLSRVTAATLVRWPPVYWQPKKLFIMTKHYRQFQNNYSRQHHNRGMVMPSKLLLDCMLRILKSAMGLHYIMPFSLVVFDLFHCWPPCVTLCYFTTNRAVKICIILIIIGMLLYLRNWAKGISNINKANLRDLIAATGLVILLKLD